MVNQVTANTNQISLPTPEEMEAAVESLPPVLPKNLEQQPTVVNESTPNIQLANTPEDLSAPQATNYSFEDLKKKAIKYLPKAVGIGLTLQSLRGIYNSVAFILVDYPALEQKLVAHQITETQVSELVVMMVILLISTMISLFFGMRLTFVKTATAKRISTTIGLILFFGNPFIRDLILQIHLSEWIVSFFGQSVQSIYETPKQVIENTPFLEQGAGGELETVWYK